MARMILDFIGLCIVITSGPTIIWLIYIIGGEA
jgi:hypothetical protein